MAIDYYDLGRTHGRLQRLDKAGQAVVGALQLGSEATKMASDIYSVVTEQQEKLSAEMQKTADRTIATFLTNGMNEAEAQIYNNPDYFNNPDLGASASQEYVDNLFDADTIYAGVSAKGVTREQVETAMNSDWFANTYSAALTSNTSWMNNSVLASYQTNMRTGYAEIASSAGSIEEAGALIGQLYADSGDKSVVDPSRIVDPSRPTVAASWKGTYVLANAERSMKGIIESSPFSSKDDIVAGFLTQFDDAVGDTSGYQQWEQAAIYRTREELKTQLEQTFEAENQAYQQMVDNRIDRFTSEYGIAMASGRATYEDLYNGLMEVGIDGRHPAEQALITESVISIAKGIDTLGEAKGNMSALTALASRYGVKAFVDEEDPLAFGYEILGADEYVFQQEHDSRASAPQSDSYVKDLIQSAMDMTAEKAGEIYSKDKDDNQEKLVDNILYGRPDLEDEDKMDILDACFAGGQIDGETYSDAIGKVGKVNSSYKQAVSNSIDQMKAFIDTLGLESADKAALEYEMFYGNSKSIWSLVARANGNVPDRQTLEGFVTTYSDAMFQKSFFDDYYKQLTKSVRITGRPGNEYMATDLAGTGTTENVDRVGSLLFSTGSGGSISAGSPTEFYQDYQSGEYEGLVDDDAVAIVRSTLLNNRNGDTARKDLFEMTARAMYGDDYGDLSTFERNMVEVTASAALCEAIQVADLANVLDRGKGIDTEYAEVNVPGYGKGLLTKGGMLICSRPSDFEDTWGTRRYVYCPVDVTGEQYRSVWGPDADREKAVVLMDSAKMKTAVMPKDEDGKYIPLTESGAMWRYITGDDYGVIEKFGKLASNTPR